MALNSRNPQQDIDEELLALRTSLHNGNSVQAIDRREESLELYQWRWLNDALIRRDWRSTFSHVIATIPLPEVTIPPVNTAVPQTTVYNLSHRGHQFSGCARVPLELIDEILLHLSAQYRQRQQSLPRMSPDHELNRLCGPVIKCSLVCRRWANQCRKYIFSGEPIKLCSFEDAEWFYKYATQGSPFLIPLHSLIGRISVQQGYDAPFSYYRHLQPHLSVFNRPIFTELEICGPIPNDFPPDKLNTPHWGVVPLSASQPSLQPYRLIMVRNIHFSSFANLVSYVQHFQESHFIAFRYLRWPIELLEQDVPIDVQRRDTDTTDPGHTMSVFADQCTDDFKLCFQVATSHPGSVIHHIRDDEWREILSLWMQTQKLFFCEEDIPCCHIMTRFPEDPQAEGLFAADIRFEATRMVWLWDLSLLFTNQRPRDSQTFNLRVVGCSLLLDFKSPNNTEPDAEDTVSEDEDLWHLDVLLTYLRNFRMLQVVSFCFVNYQELRAAMSYHSSLLIDHRVNNVKIVLALSDPKGQIGSNEWGKVIGIDPKTLTPNGQSWQDYKAIVPSLLGAL